MIKVLRLFSLLSLAAFCSSSYAQTNREWLIRFSEEQQLRSVTERAEAISIADSLGLPVRFSPDDFTVFELQRFENGFPRYNITHNINAAKTISTDKVWPGGSAGLSLTGSGQIIGIWDSGRVRLTHQEFQGRAFQIDNAATNSNHATHVGGTMVAGGVNAEAIGMSYQATLHAHDWNNDLSEMAAAAAGGLQLSNHSYGYVTGWRFNFRNDNRWVWFGDTTVSILYDYSFGFYNTEAQSWDQLAFAAPYYLIIRSAGNDRLEGPSTQPVVHWVWTGSNYVLSSTIRQRDGGPDGFDCIAHNGISKNVLTIGAVHDIPGGYTQPSDVVMSNFSCWGPTDDGRIKPDLVGNGVTLLSTIATSNSAYASYSGTSMSSPNITGSAALLLQHYAALNSSDSMMAATLKGLLIHTADEAGPAPGPDYVFGWGLMNTARAAAVITSDTAFGGGLHIRELTLNQGQTLNIPLFATENQPLKATISWTDPPGIPPPAALNPPNLMLVNDIDVRLIGGASPVVFPWILDPVNPSAPATTGDNFRDNVEVVLLSQPVAGATYTLQISHKGALTGNKQNLSLIVTGNVHGMPTCIAPAQLQAFAINSTTVALIWLPGGQEQQWEIEWGEEGFQQGTGTTVSTPTIPMLTLSSLAPETSYMFYVRAICSAGDTSFWAGPETFMTPCDSVTVSLNIFANQLSVCEGDSVNFWLEWENGGENPYFQWFVNDLPVGEPSPIFEYLPSNGDTIFATLVSSNPCAVNNPAFSDSLIISVFAPPSIYWTLYPDTICLNWPAFELSGALPAGGVYSGPGVSGGWFYPDLAGIGSHWLKYYYLDLNGCADLDSVMIMVDACVAIAGEITSGDIILFPNPTRQQFTVKTEQHHDAINSISIYSIIGKPVLKLERIGKRSVVVDVSELDSGIYTVEVIATSGRVMKRIMVDRE